MKEGGGGGSEFLSAPTAGNIAITSGKPDEDQGEIGTHWLTRREVLREGDRRGERPRFGATCRVAIRAIKCGSKGRGGGGTVTEEDLTGDFFYSKYFNRLHSGEVQVGGADSELDKALELCVRAMRPGESCLALMGARLDLWRNGRRQDEGSSKWAEAEVECEVTLETVLNAQPLHKWYPETKFDKAQESNAAAVRLFKLGRTADAFHKFHLTLTLLTFILEEDETAKKRKKAGDEACQQVSEEVLSQASEMSQTCLSNLAACHFRWGNHALVARLASKVLEKQPANVKLLYRRGVANLEMRDFEAARKDLVEAHRLDPSNKAINDKMGALRVQETKHLEQLAGGMKKMFG